MIIKTHTSINEFEKNSWNTCFKNNVEDYDFYRTVEEAKIKNFKFEYIAIYDNTILVSIIPIFYTNYNLGTTLDNNFNNIIKFIKKIYKNFLDVKLACIGSVISENFTFTINEVNLYNKQEIFILLIDYFKKNSLTKGNYILGIKDLSHDSILEYENILLKLGFVGLNSLPTATLEIKFDNFESYIKTLSKSRQKNLKRKLRNLDLVKIIKTDNIDNYVDEIYEMYLYTLNNSEFRFEELSKLFFINILKTMKGTSFYNLYFLNDQLIAANLLIQNDQILIDKYLVMKPIIARKYDIYFISWCQNIKICIENNFTHFQSGQSGYYDKIKLGSKLINNNIYFLHNNFIIHNILKFLVPFLKFDI